VHLFSRPEFSSLPTMLLLVILMIVLFFSQNILCSKSIHRNEEAHGSTEAIMIRSMKYSAGFSFFCYTKGEILKLLDSHKDPNDYFISKIRSISESEEFGTARKNYKYLIQWDI